MSVFYDDLDTFFAARGLRRARENSEQPWLEDSYDYGLYWKDGRGNNHRLTWIGTTNRAEGDGGELYLVRLQGGGTKALSGSLTMMSAGIDSGAVELLCIIPPVPAAESHDPAANVGGILTGWAEICGEPNSIDWLRDGVAAAIEAGWALAP